MSVGRISTYALQQMTLRDSSKVQLTLAQQQEQLSSGNKSPDFAGLGGSNSEQFLSLQNRIAKIDTYENNNRIATTRLETTNTVLGQVIDTASNLKSLISQRRNAASNSSAFPASLQGVWQSLVGQLNVSLEGRYLFSGTRTDTPAVNPDTFPTLKEDGVPDDSYYQGDKEDFTIRADDDAFFTGNVRADDPGIQKIFAGLAMAQKGNDNLSDADLQKAYDLVSEGLEGVVATQAVVSQTKVSLSDISTRHTSFKLYYQGVKEEIGNTDLVSVTTQVAINQGILQAAFQAFAKINSLKLSDYLK